MNIIEFENIYVSYNIEPILKEINLTIREHEHWVILGSNGSGKSTLMKLFSNEIYPHAKYPYKKKIFNKERFTTMELRQHLGIITNDLHIYFEQHGAFLTVYEVILSGYYASIGVFKHQDFTPAQHNRAMEVLKYLNLEALKDRQVATLSTGQLRKAIIGRALIHKPKAFILDEPTIGLDFKAQQNFIQLLRALSKEASIIIITHHLDEIFPEITHAALMYNQTIYKQGKKEEILNSKNFSEIFGVNIDLEYEKNRYYIKSIQN